MEIIKLHGTEQRLYELVCSLVMNPAVLRQNNNYPFKTGHKYIWFVALEQGRTVGFLPVKKRTDNSFLIDNYYIKDDDEYILHALLKQTVESLENPKLILWATVRKQHAGLFMQHKFLAHIEWIKYNKMLYSPNTQNQCTD